VGSTTIVVVVVGRCGRRLECWTAGSQGSRGEAHSRWHARWAVSSALRCSWLLWARTTVVVVVVVLVVLVVVLVLVLVCVCVSGVGGGGGCLQ
jgi:hypothetical protein